MGAQVFVYGTLMRGEANHRVLAGLGARFVARAKTKAPRTLVDLGPYPALLAADTTRDATRVGGEIHELDDAALAQLDAFEGCPDLFRRERMVVVVESADEGAHVEAFVYVLARRVPRSARVIETGRYAGGGLALTHDAAEIDLDAGDDD